MIIQVRSAVVSVLQYFEMMALRQNYAGFWLRAAAFVIDNVILGVLNLFISFLAVAFFQSSLVEIENSDPGLLQSGLKFTVFIYQMTTSWLYYSVCESAKWQGTPGKMLLGIQVTSLTGERISFPRASGRFFARILSGITLGVGYLMAGLTQKKQALHDLLARTLVVRRPQVETMTSRPASDEEISPPRAA